MPTYLTAYDSGGTTSAVSINAVWYTWCDGTASTSLANFINGGTATNLTTGGSTANTIWVTWTTSGTTANSVIDVIHAPYVDPRTAEQRLADEVRYTEQLRDEQQRLAERETAQKAASVRARALLLSMLEVHQREQLQRDQYFEVIARHSKRRYRIRQGTHGNVRLLDAEGREVTRYCGQPNGVPTEDCMLAQKLQLEHDEEAFLRAANASRVA
jgi:hypothetical protein